MTSPLPACRSPAVSNNFGWGVTNLSGDFVGAYFIGATTIAATARPEGNNEARLFNGYQDQFEGAVSSLNVTNIPFASYNVYCYVRPDQRPVPGGYFQVTNNSAQKWIKGGTVSATALPLSRQ